LADAVRAVLGETGQTTHCRFRKLLKNGGKPFASSGFPHLGFGIHE
jgi:hypothetical protein